VQCWGDDKLGKATPPPGAFASVSAAATHTCGVSWQGTIQCWGDDPHAAHRPRQGGFTSVSVDHFGSVALASDGRGTYWNAGGRSNVPGSFRDLHTAGTGASGVDRSGPAVVWSPSGASKVIARGPFAQVVTADDGSGCGRAEDGHIECWPAGASRWRGWSQERDHTSLSGNGVAFCATTRAGGIRCLGDSWLSTVQPERSPE
jgi:hypothetical protein